MKIDGYGLKLDDVWSVAQGEVKEISIAPKALAAMKESRKYIEGRIAEGDTIYGVNTGFGAFSSVKISKAEIVQLQKNLIRSHSCGVGEMFRAEKVRAIMLLRANALVRGHSGVRPMVVEKLLEFLKHDLLP